MKNPMFSKRHYEAIAKVLSENLQRFEIVDSLIKIFSEDNERFDPIRFNEACKTEMERKDASSSQDSFDPELEQELSFQDRLDKLEKEHKLYLESNPKTFDITYPESAKTKGGEKHD